MDLVAAAILGLVQGLTEFLPISSSGHILLVGEFLLGGKDPGAGFTAVIQIGTLLAVLIYFWKDLVRVLGTWGRSFGDRSLRSEPDVRLAWGIAAGTVPIVVAGLLLKHQIEGVFRSPLVVATGLALLGILMGAADHFGKKNREITEFSVADGVKMGLWQCLALVPGSSRSGSTITGGLLMGYDRAAAARVSFLLSIPAVALSGVYQLVSARKELLGAGLMPTVVATAVAFVSGYAAIAFLMNFLKNHSTWGFVFYRIALAIGIVVMVAQGILKG